MNTELKETFKLLTKVQANPSVGPDQGAKLQRAKRDLMAAVQGGKLDKRRLFRAIEGIARTLQETIEHDD